MTTNTKITTVTLNVTLPGSSFEDGKFTIPHGLPVEPKTATAIGVSPNTRGITAGEGLPGTGFTRSIEGANICLNYVDNIDPLQDYTFEITATSYEI